MRLTLLALISLLGVHFALAQYYGAIKIDRPGLSNDYSIVKKYRLQIESGISYSTDTNFPLSPNLEEQQLQIAQTLIRFGLPHRFELRVGSQFVYQRQKRLNWKNSLATIGGMFVGSKWQFLEHKKGFLPNASVLMRVDLPVGSRQIVSSNIEPQAGILASHPLSDAAQFNYNVTVSYRNNSYVQYFYATSLSVDFSPQTSVFIEIAANDPDNGPGQTIFDGGLSLLVKRNFIVDIYGGKGLNKEAPDWFISFGGGIRLPR